MGRRPFRRLSCTLVVALTVAVLPGPPAAAATPVLVYRFEGYPATARVADSSGAAHHGYTLRSAGGTVRPVNRSGGTAVAFPAPCHAGSRICPRAVVETPHRNRLDPGTRPLRYGALIRLPASHTSAGSNVVQKGFYHSMSQWKLQVDGSAGRPSCVLVGNGRAYRVWSRSSVADGRWHRVQCRRHGGEFTVLVDCRVTGRAAVPVSLSIGNTAPVRIGGNGAGQYNDQFFGALDDVVVTIG